MTLDDENEDILVQIQEEQRQLPQRFARRLHRAGKREIDFVFPTIFRGREQKKVSNSVKKKLLSRLQEQG